MTREFVSLLAVVAVACGTSTPSSPTTLEATHQVTDGGARGLLHPWLRMTNGIHLPPMTAEVPGPLGDGGVKPPVDAGPAPDFEPNQLSLAYAPAPEATGNPACASVWPKPIPPLRCNRNPGPDLHPGYVFSMPRESDDLGDLDFDAIGRNDRFQTRLVDLRGDDLVFPWSAWPLASGFYAVSRAADAGTAVASFAYPLDGGWGRTEVAVPEETQLAVGMSSLGLLYRSPAGGVPWVQWFSSRGEPLGDPISLPFAQSIGAEIDVNDRALIFFQPPGGDGGVESQRAVWVGPDGVLGDDFAFPYGDYRGATGAFLVGGGLVVNSQSVSEDGTIGPAPEWLANARGSPGNQLVLGRSFYAVYPASFCNPVTIVASDGRRCGALSAVLPDGGCPGMQYFLRDGTLVIESPQDTAADFTCWWPGLLR